MGKVKNVMRETKFMITKPTKSGNGSHIIVPKGWLGKKVLVVRI